MVSSSPADTTLLLLPLQLPEDADLSGIRAQFKEGVLAVTVKRMAPTQPDVQDVRIDEWMDGATQA